MEQYEKIRLMNRQIAVLDKHKISYEAEWKRIRDAKKTIQGAISILGENEKSLASALNTAIEALKQIQIEKDNPPLNKLTLKRLDGEPVWVVSVAHSGRWGIVDADNELVRFPYPDDEYPEAWFAGCYIFRYKKEIVDYSELLQKNNLLPYENHNLGSED